MKFKKSLLPVVFLVLFIAIYFLNKPNTKPLIFEDFELVKDLNLDGPVFSDISKRWILVSNYEDTSTKNASIDSFVCSIVNSNNMFQDTSIKEKHFLFIRKMKNSNPSDIKQMSPELVKEVMELNAISKYSFYSSGLIQVWLYNNGKLWTIRHKFSCD